MGGGGVACNPHSVSCSLRRSARVRAAMWTAAPSGCLTLGRWVVRGHMCGAPSRPGGGVAAGKVCEPRNLSVRGAGGGPLRPNQRPGGWGDTAAGSHGILCSIAGVEHPQCQAVSRFEQYFFLVPRRLDFVLAGLATVTIAMLFIAIIIITAVWLIIAAIIVVSITVIIYARAAVQGLHLTSPPPHELRHKCFGGGARSNGIGRPCESMSSICHRCFHTGKDIIVAVPVASGTPQECI